MPYLRQIAPGRWYVQLSAGTGKDRKRKTTTVYAKTEKAALRDALNLEATFQEEAKQDRVDPLIRDFLADWLANDQRRRRPATKSQYRLSVERWCDELGDERVSTLTPQRVQDVEQRWLTSGRKRTWGKFPEAKGITSGTLATHRTVLLLALKWGKRRGQLADLEPLDRSPAGERVIFTLAQARTFLTLLDLDTYVEWRVIWRTAIGCGLRLGELRGLRREHVELDGSGGVLHIREQISLLRGRDNYGPVKGKQWRDVPVPPQLAPYLAEQLASHAHDYVFANDAGGPFSGQRARYALHKLCRKNGLPDITPHSLRHSYATFALAAGVDLSYVSWYMGHAKVSLTRDLYGHVVDEIGAANAARSGAFLHGDGPVLGTNATGNATNRDAVSGVI